MSDERERFLANVREIFTRTAYSHKTFEIEREWAAARCWWTRWVNIGSASATLALASLTAIKVSQGWTFDFEIYTVIVGAVAFLVSLYQSVSNPEKQEAAYRLAAKEHLGIRDQLQFLIEKILNGGELQQLNAERERILAAREMLYRWAPDTSPQAYKEAVKALEEREHLTIHQHETDQLLPAAMRSAPITPLKTVAGGSKEQ